MVSFFRNFANAPKNQYLRKNVTSQHEGYVPELLRHTITNVIYLMWHHII